MINYLIPSIMVAGVFGAIAGRYFSHKYIVNRENVKYYKECLQNLYSPLIDRVIEYLIYESETSCYTVNPKFGDMEYEIREIQPLYLEGDTTKKFKEILSTIGDNLIYVREDLIKGYEAAKKCSEFKYRQGMFGLWDSVQIQRSRMEVCAAILSGYLSINMRLKTLSKMVKEEIEAAYFFTLLFLILLDLGLQELAIDHSFRDMKLVITGFKINKSLLKTFELIRLRYNHAEDHSKKFSVIEKNHLEVDSFKTILKFIDSMETLDSERAEFWRMQINQRSPKLEKLVIKDLLDR